MKYSYSRVSTFKMCKYRFYLQYVKKLKLIEIPEDDSALILGSTIHLAIEKGIEAAEKFYFSQFNILTDNQINEFLKIELLLPRIMKLLPEGKCEIELDHPTFTGFIDRLVQTSENTFDIYDYKYTNNVDSYMESAQLHLYKYFFELLNPKFTVNNLYFVFIPKTRIRQKENEDIFEFRQRIKSELAAKEILVKKVDYDKNKVDMFFNDIKNIESCQEFDKNVTNFCNWCSFKEYCEGNGDYLIIDDEEN